MNEIIGLGLYGLTVFTQGLLSFFSPCVLPLVPMYVGYLSGGAQIVAEDGTVTYPRKKIMLNTLFFVLGVSFAFFGLGLGFSAAGMFFKGNRMLFARIGGVLVMLFGFYQMGWLGSGGALSREYRVHLRLDKVAMNPLTALLLGFTFSFAWSPCIGPALAGVLLATSTAASPTTGMLLIAVYTLGFVLPFLAVGLFTGQLLKLFRRHQKVVAYTVKAGGVLMILMGVMMFTGWMNSVTGYLSSFGAVPSPNPGVTQSSSNGSANPDPSPEPQRPNSGVTPPPAPDFTLTDQYGNSHKLSDYKGKVVFLNFWATWCGYCVEEMPEIEELYKEYGLNENEVVILGVANPRTDDAPKNADIEEQKIIDFLAEREFTYPTVMDRTGKIFAAYGLSSFPTTFMIDTEGNVYGYASGQLPKDKMKQFITETQDSTELAP